GSAGTRRWCGRRRWHGGEECDVSGRRRRVSIFGESATLLADRRNLCRGFQVTFGRRISSHGKPDVDLASLNSEFVSMAELWRAREFRRPSSFQFRENDVA